MSPRIVVSGCAAVDSFAKGWNYCRLGCEAGFFVEKMVEGMCSPDKDSNTASYQGQFVTCGQCAPVANAAEGAIMTCSNPRNSQLRSNPDHTGSLCADGYFFVDRTQGAADECRECTPIVRCAVGRTACSSAAISVCSECRPGFAGQQCQGAHAEGCRAPCPWPCAFRCPPS